MMVTKGTFTFDNILMAVSIFVATVVALLLIATGKAFVEGLIVLGAMFLITLSIFYNDVKTGMFG